MQRHICEMVFHWVLQSLNWKKSAMKFLSAVRNEFAGFDETCNAPGNCCGELVALPMFPKVWLLSVSQSRTVREQQSDIRKVENGFHMLGSLKNLGVFSLRRWRELALKSIVLWVSWKMGKDEKIVSSNARRRSIKGGW